jgi:spermidine/putrescine transport system substrate-binding protein
MSRAPPTRHDAPDGESPAATGDEADHEPGGHQNTMTRRPAVWLLLTILAGAIAAPTGSGQDAPEKTTLRVYSWPNYFDEYVIRQFETENDVDVVVETYLSNEVLMEALAKQHAAGQMPYDIVVPSDYAVARLRAAGLLERLDPDALAGMKGFDPFFLKQYFDPANQFSVPFLWGTAGIAYNSEVVTKPPTDWDSLFDTTYRGRISMLDDPREVFAVALKSLGYSANTSDANQIEEAKRKLIQQVALVKTYRSDTEELMYKDEVVLAHTWSGTPMRVMRDRPKWRYVVPRSGATFFIDTLAIPVGAPNKALAMKFIGFVLDPKNIALLTEYSRYANCVSASRRFVQRGIATDRNIYPNKLVLSKLEMLQAVPEVLLPTPETIAGQQVTTLYEKAWAEVKLTIDAASQPQ